MPSRKDKIIVDTNLWISFLLSKDLAKLDLILANNKAVLVFSDELLDELLSVVQRDKFRKYFSVDDTTELLLKIRNKAIFVSVSSCVEICRDPKDNFLLALAQDSQASHLITGDKDLLVLAHHHKTKILTISQYFLEKAD